MLGSVIMIMIFGFVTGGLARLAVPGPDPMPVWLTVAIGLVGSAAGGAVAISIWGRGTQGIGLFSFIGAILLVIAYRRFVQKRPIVGPEAFAFPERGFGIERFRERRQQVQDMVRQAERARGGDDPDETQANLRKLAELHEAGILSDEEYEAKKAQVLAG
jgi:uncharacterized membrane protein YeaQ/YmgE (transglycosylase-associated protein family)